jgi:negative regulator of flagellin synthesis FlgM
MTTSIQNNGLPNFPAATSGTGNASGSAPAAVDNPAAVPPKADDQLKLTDSALALQEAARLDTSSAIDSKRVEQIRQALADGSYQVDAGRIADRMLTLERQLGSTGAA